MNVSEEIAQSVQIPIFLIPPEGFDFIEVVGLQQSGDFVVVHHDHFFHVSAEDLHVFQVVGFVDYEAVLAVEAVGDAGFGVD
jgi:hypothetical protein